MISEVATPVVGATATGPRSRAISQTIRRRQVRLTGVPAIVPWARRVLQSMLLEWRLEDMSDPALLLVSELVTNAVHASGGCYCQRSQNQVIVLTVTLTETGLLLEVWDSSPAAPVLGEADISDDQGRGLMLVDFMADAWGHRPESGGTVVWCELTTGSQAGTDPKG